ncbi:Transketolase [Mucor velutinosus]|uniref:RING-type E3 ubiquitin transferase n=1 Tax=Mucor velutinosus TaxID=708070 RepID=A0AAN7D3T6_9FUNG|nr:Transketolase [Mucor velutinosus]
MSSDTRQSRPRYWCHICNAEMPIYMAPDPTCQQCNEQFIEELHSDDDPREFLAGADQHNTSPNAADNDHARTPFSSRHYFEYNPATGRLNPLPGGGSNAHNHGEMGDDIFQFFTPTPAPARSNTNSSNTTEDGRERPPATEGPPSPFGNIVHNLLTNLLGQSPDIVAATQNNDGEGEAGAGAGGEGGNGADGHDHDGRSMVFFGNMLDGNVSFQSVPAGQAMPGGLPNLGATLAAAAAAANADERNEDGDSTNPGTRNTNEDRRGNHIANLLQFLSDMTGGAFDSGIIGNPNDYVFSQTALDNIITQLMEQNGGHAPPPAPEQVIESLQKRPLTDKEKSQEADCAVCKDQFESQEQVIELPCEHIFHDECIKPWLKLNSTCPVCRHSVLPDQQEQDSTNNSNADDNNGPNDNTQSNATQGETNRSVADDNNNNNNNNSSSDNGGRGSHAGWTSTGNGNNEPQVASWPLNLSVAFPWAEIGRQDSDSNNNSSNNSSNNNSNTTDTSTTNTTSTSTNDANQNTTTPHIDENLDLDLD